jgi:hypothetical protein
MSTFTGGAEDDRLARLEQEVERLSGLVRKSVQTTQSLAWLLIGGVVLCAAGLVALHEMGMLKLEGLTGGVAKTVESREFGFYNQEGNRVLLVDKDKFGYPNLVLMDLKKQYRMGVKVWPEGGGTPGLVFYDPSGVRGHLRMDENEASVLKLTGEKQKGGISLSVSADGDPTVIVTDKTGKVIFAIPEGASNPKPPEPMKPGIMPGSSDRSRAVAH